MPLLLVVCLSTRSALRQDYLPIVLEDEVVVSHFPRPRQYLLYEPPYSCSVTRAVALETRAPKGQTWPVVLSRALGHLLKEMLPFVLVKPELAEPLQWLVMGLLTASIE